MKKNLVLLDTDHIKRYVFATDTLKEIRGASALLDELNRIDMKRVAQQIDPDAETIYANGGAGLFMVAADDPDTLIQRVQQEYRQTTVAGSISGVAEALPDDWNRPEQTPYLKEIIQRLFLRLQIKKAESCEPATVVSHPLLKDCESCDRDYASEEYEGDLLCRSCVNKREKDKDIKQREIPQTLRDLTTLSPHEKPLWRRLGAALKSELDGKDFRRPEDFNELGELSTPANYIGLIYADGNNMGVLIDQLIERAEHPIDALKTLAGSVDEAINAATFEAIRRHLLPAANQGVFPFEILLLGGDDLVMVTTAHKAIETAITITKEFHERTEGLGDQGLTLSASVILAHAKFPFATSLSLAESALKFTKKEFAKLRINNANATPEGMINFMVVHSPNTLDFDALYAQELTDKAQQLYRTLRPYPVGQLERLQEAVQRSLPNIPRTKLHQIREAISLDKHRAMLGTFAALLRAKEYEKTEILKIVKDFAGQAGRQPLEYPWYSRQDEETGEIRYYTPLLDAIELYEFLEKDTP